MANTVVRLPRVKAKTGLSRSTIYAQIAQGKSPRPLTLGPRAVGWLEADIEAWLLSRLNERK